MIVAVIIWDGTATTADAGAVVVVVLVEVVRWDMTSHTHGGVDMLAAALTNSIATAYHLPISGVIIVVVPSTVVTTAAVLLLLLLGCGAIWLPRLCIGA